MGSAATNPFAFSQADDASSTRLRHIYTFSSSKFPLLPLNRRNLALLSFSNWTAPLRRKTRKYKHEAQASEFEWNVFIRLRFVLVLVLKYALGATHPANKSLIRPMPIDVLDRGFMSPSDLVDRHAEYRCQPLPVCWAGRPAAFDNRLNPAGAQAASLD